MRERGSNGKGKERKGQRGEATGDCGVEEMSSSNYLFSGGIVKHDFSWDRWHLLHAKLPYAPSKEERERRGRDRRGREKEGGGRKRERDGGRDVRAGRRTALMWRNSHGREYVSAACTHSFIPVTQDVDITCNQWVNATPLNQAIVSAYLFTFTR